MFLARRHLAAALVAGSVLATGSSAAWAAAPAKPNLVVAKATGLPKGALAAGSSVSVKATVSNSGKGKAGKSQVELVLSKDAKRDVTDVALGRTKTAALAAHKTAKVTATGTIPSTTAGGGYSVLVCADAALSVKESSEKDNCKPAGTLTVRATTPTTEPGTNLPVGGSPPSAGGGAAPAPPPTPTPTPDPTPTPTPTPMPEKTPAVSIADAQVTEGTGGASQMSFQLTLDHAVSGEVSVGVHTEAGTATADADFVPVTARVLFPAGSTAQSLVVTVVGDAIDEPSEQFAVELSDPVGATIDRARAVGTILDDDDPPAPGPIQISIDDAAAKEGDSGETPVAMTVRLSRAATATTSVRVRTLTTGDATAGVDYIALDQRVEIPAAATTATVTVKVLGDGAPEPDEHVAVAISEPSGAVLDDAQAQLTILDDDATPDAPPVSPAAPADTPPQSPTTALGSEAGAPAPTDFKTGIDFLYTSPDPIQTGVAANAVSGRRATVLRGRALTTSGTPIPGARVTVVGHPELGRTATRDDGRFDLVANGGGDLILDFDRAGYLPVQRTVANAPWQDYVEIGDVVLRSMTRDVDQVELGGGTKVAAGPPVTDAAGQRQSTLVFPAGAGATAVKPDGTTVDLSTLGVRSTEYTAGTVGPDAMPGNLPPTSGFTYAVELSADEAVRLGADQVRFDKPVINYVDNFLGLTAGTHVPAGYYDRDKGQWVAGPDGIVIKLTAIRDGVADVDITGDGVADTAAELLGVGIDDAERRVLATRWTVGKSLWRMSITHFTPWDYNFPYGPPKKAKKPKKPSLLDRLKQVACGSSGSIIECDSQVLREELPVPGTGMTLAYSTERAGTRIADRTVTTRVDPDLPSEATAVVLTLDIAGRTITKSFDPAPGADVSIAWDGTDAYGRPVVHPVKGRLMVGYRYPLEYQDAADFATSFGRLSGVPMVTDRTNRTVDLVSEREVTLGGFDARTVGLGGWTISDHHTLDPDTGTVYLGDGGRLDGAAVTFGPPLRPFAGDGAEADSGDGAAAVAAHVLGPRGLAVGPDGTVYIADPRADRVRAVSPDGVIRTVAGNGTAGFSGDGGLATSAQLSEPTAVAVAADGSVLIADTNNNRIRRVAPNGRISTAAGGGSPTDGLGDGLLAAGARLRGPQGIAVAPGGGFWLSDTNAHRIRVVGSDGRITTAAGTGVPGTNGLGGPGSLAEVHRPTGLAVDRQGRLLIAETGAGIVARLGTDGVLNRIAGGGTPTDGVGDGPQATDAELDEPTAVAVSPEGDVLIADSGHRRVRRVLDGGRISTFAGSGRAPRSGTALGSTLGTLTGIAVRADGAVLFGEYDDHRVRIAPPRRVELAESELVVPNPTTGEVYVFDENGRHLRTLQAITGQVLRTFRYTSDGLLASIDEGDGNVVTIEHAADGKPTAIVGPYGARNVLTTDAAGRLTRLDDPAHDATDLKYDTAGLLSSYDKGGAPHTFEYDALGQLTRDSSTARTQRLVRKDLDGGVEVELQSGARRTTYATTTDTEGGVQHTVKRGARPTSSAARQPDGTTTVTGTDGSTMSSSSIPDDRFAGAVPQGTGNTFQAADGTSLSTSYSSTQAGASVANGPFEFDTISDQLTVGTRSVGSTYDSRSKTTTVQAAGGTPLSSTLDASGRVATYSSGTGIAPVSYAYDAHGRLTRVSQGMSTTSYSYDANGSLSHVIDGDGMTVDLTTDASGALDRLSTSGRAPLTFKRDARGNTTAISLGGGQDWSMAYDGDDNLTTVTAPPRAPGDTRPRTSTLSYDASGLLSGWARPGRDPVTLSRDTAGAVTAMDYGAEHVGITRSAEGDLTALDNGTVREEVHGSGGVDTGTTYSGVVSGQVTRAFDADQDMTSMAVNGDQIATYAYGADSALERAGDLVLNRSPDDRRTTGATVGSLALAFTRDSFGRRTGITLEHGGTTLFKETVGLSAAGRVNEATENGATTTYQRDAAGQLTTVKRGAATVGAYSYDDHGNRTSADDAKHDHVTVATNARNELTSAGADRFTYTDAGDLKSWTDASGKVTRFTYDALGALRKVEREGAPTVTYDVDGAGRRVRRLVGGAATSGWLYGGGAPGPVAELDGQGDVRSTFVYAHGSGAPDLMRRDGHTYLLVTDHIGSVRRVVDVASGAVAQQLDYDAWGVVTNDSNPGFQPFGFAGGLYDSATGLVRFGARDYAATLGRWTAEDPLGLATLQTNLHAYSANDPVSMQDPDGRFAFLAVAAAGCAVSAGWDFACGERNPKKLAVSCAVGAITSLVPLGIGAKGAVRITTSVAKPAAKRLIATSAVNATVSTYGDVVGEYWATGQVTMTPAEALQQTAVSFGVGLVMGGKSPAKTPKSPQSNYHFSTNTRLRAERAISATADEAESALAGEVAGHEVDGVIDIATNDPALDLDGDGNIEDEGDTGW